MALAHFDALGINSEVAIAHPTFDRALQDPVGPRRAPRRGGV